jgi:hypothetical protein
MTFDEVLTLASSNKKLHKFLLKRGFSETFDEIIEFDGKWDAEDKMNFDTPTLGIKIGNEFDLMNVDAKFAKLYDDYNWKGIQLSDDRYIFLTVNDEYYIVNPKNMEDGGVELTAWGFADRIKEGTDIHARLYGLRNDPKLN